MVSVSRLLGHWLSVPDDARAIALRTPYLEIV